MLENQPKYLTRTEVLSRYGIGNTTLYRWIHDEEIQFPKPIQLGARCVRFLVSALDQWEEQRRADTAQ
ncbi:helix-turn-helix transcriptional regulator [Kistimonas asteriae]|uniref:helix-turn-helix transcriptional regulator n=1 Tax=Kistimonas asteriae TaxID=517724 RepID=UPI001BA93D25|nr:AlpA family phage regulatory protein [Kistimonas asteriae]